MDCSIGYMSGGGGGEDIVGRTGHDKSRTVTGNNWFKVVQRLQPNGTLSPWVIYKLWLSGTSPECRAITRTRRLFITVNCCSRLILPCRHIVFLSCAWYMLLLY
jgi:hypothetical protein